MSEGAKGVEEGPSGLERILKYLPSYSGYKEKENRRETNKLIRIKVVASLKCGIEKLDMAARATTEERAFDKAKKLDRLNMILTKLAEKITHALDGNAHLFDSIKVKEGDIDNLINNDVSLTETAGKIDEACLSLLKATNQREFDSLDDGLDHVDVLIQQMDNLLARRKEALPGISDSV